MADPGVELSQDRHLGRHPELDHLPLPGPSCSASAPRRGFAGGQPVTHRPESFEGLSDHRTRASPSGPTRSRAATDCRTSSSHFCLAPGERGQTGRIAAGGLVDTRSSASSASTSPRLPWRRSIRRSVRIVTTVPGPGPGRDRPPLFAGRREGSGPHDREGSRSPARAVHRKLQVPPHPRRQYATQDDARLRGREVGCRSTSPRVAAPPSTPRSRPSGRRGRAAHWTVEVVLVLDLGDGSHASIPLSTSMTSAGRTRATHVGIIDDLSGVRLVLGRDEHSHALVSCHSGSRPPASSAEVVAAIVGFEHPHDELRLDEARADERRSW